MRLHVRALEHAARFDRNPSTGRICSCAFEETVHFCCRYFQYTAWLLPLSYNAYADRLEVNLTPGGESPLIVHHTVHKPFPQATKTTTSYPGHQFLCSG